VAGSSSPVLFIILYFIFILLLFRLLSFSVSFLSPLDMGMGVSHYFPAQSERMLMIMGMSFRCFVDFSYSSEIQAYVLPSSWIRKLESKASVDVFCMYLSLKGKEDACL